MVRLRIPVVIGAVWALGICSYQAGFCASDGELNTESRGLADISVTVPMRLNLAVDSRERLVTLETNIAPDRARFSFSGSLGDPEVTVRSVPRNEQPDQFRLAQRGSARRWRGVFKVYGEALRGSPVASVALQTPRHRETLTFMIEPT